MKTHIKYFSLFIFLITLISSTSHAQMSQSNKSAVPYNSITSQVESTLERTAIVALRHITQARSDIHRKELISARSELDKAEKLMETINDDLSTTTVKNFIWVARKHLEYEQVQQVMHDFPPIYSSLEMISVYIPTDKAKMYVDRAKGYLEKDKKWEAERDLSLAEKSLIVIEVELPLLKTQRYVTMAKEYLVKNNPKKADEALRIAEHRATALYYGMNSPIIQAKQNVWLAFRNYSTAKRAEAGAHIAQARKFLNTVATGASTKGKEEANKFSAELGGLEKKLTGEGRVVESEMKAAWEKSEALAERSAAYLSAGLSETETTLGEESNMIEARLHVAYAETYQVTTFEPDKAVKELDIAYSYLQKAERNTLTDSADRKKMREIGNILLDLKLTPNENDSTVRDRYETVKEELRNFSVDEQSSDQIQEIQSM